MSGRCSLRLLALSLLLASGSPVGQGQTNLSRPNPSLGAKIESAVRPRLIRSPTREPVSRPPNPVRVPEINGLSHMVRAAGMIFSGTVIRIEPRAHANGQSVETIAITFRVEKALRGVTAGHNTTISQWIGLWSSGQSYRVGERVLLFLYPRSKLGLTSLVAGTMGRFDVDSWGYIELSPRHLSTLRENPVLGGRSRVSFSDFALAVRQAREEE